MSIKLWIDDVRTPPDETWTWAKTAYEAIGIIIAHQIDEISFDHDLGKPYQDIQELTGYDIAKTIEDLVYLKSIPPLKWSIHSANPVGWKSIEAAMKSAERFWERAEFAKTVKL